MKEALAAVRAELGPDALVLSTRFVPASGLRGLMGQRDVEVTAASDPTLSEVRQQQAASRPPVAADALRESIERRSASVARAPRPPAPLFDEVDEPPTRRPAARRRPAEDHAAADDALVARLMATGLDRELARDVVSALPKKSRRTASLEALRKALSSRLAPIAAGNDRYAPIEVFVGPPGAGKTTTIAKIAAQERARRGARLSLLAADGFRVGAVEQLRLYAEIIGAPFSVARSAGDIDLAVTELSRPVLVDTAGRSPSDTSLADMFSVFAGRKGVRTHLVLPATTAPRAAERILDRYQAARPDRVVLTRVDEADAWSPLLPMLRERGLTLSYLGTGQSVPDDLARVTPAMLADAVLGDEVAA
ncbi:MAG: hypothetical protein AB7O67_14705 [Vicinamibacterales bacterium]